MGETLLTTEELKGLLGITGKSIIPQWERDGMPYTEQKGRRGGKPAHLFDKRAVLAWLEANASDGMSTRARMLLRKMDGENAVSADDKANIPHTAGDGETAAEEGEVEIDEKSKGLEGALLRTEAMELRLFELEMAALAAGDIRKAAMLEKHRLAAAKGIAELREQVRVQMEKEGKLSMTEELIGIFKKNVTGVKNNILGVPCGCIPQIIPYLRDIDDAHKVEEIIQDKIYDALRAVQGSSMEEWFRTIPRIGSQGGSGRC